MSPAELDLTLLRSLRTRGHTPVAEQVVAAFSNTGEHAALWLALGAAGTVLDGRPGARARWRRGAVIVAAAYGLNTLVKYVVRRPRPQLPGRPPLTGVVSGLSMPSAHATTSFAAAGAYRGLLPAWLRYGLALAYGLSRPYLGVHYPSDVLVGAASGTALAAVWPAIGAAR
jgi:membrane-associated phospholipid phosphatase